MWKSSLQVIKVLSFLVCTPWHGADFFYFFILGMELISVQIFFSCIGKKKQTNKQMMMVWSGSETAHNFASLKIGGVYA